MASITTTTTITLGVARVQHESKAFVSSSTAAAATSSTASSSSSCGWVNTLRIHNGAAPCCRLLLSSSGGNSREKRMLLVVAAAGEDGSSPSSIGDEVGSISDESPTSKKVSLPPSSSSRISSSSKQEAKELTLDDVNPVGLGRKARQFYDDVWKRLTELGQLTRSYNDSGEEVLVGGPMCDFTTPNAELTTVLVAGATGRVGRILIRKLQLRGYKVKALVRNNDPTTLEMVPRSVQIVIGDLGDQTTLSAAVEGCNKIVCCATARSDVTGDLYRVDNRGVYNLSKAFQDYNHKLAQTRAGRSSKSKLTIVKFNAASSMEGWDLAEGTYFTDDVAVKYDGGMDAQFDLGEDDKAVFSGFVFTRGGYVELLRRISLPPGLTFDRYEGLVLSVCGDGKSYSLILKTSAGDDTSQTIQYYSRFPTRLGYSRIRIPFSSFRPMNGQDGPLDPFYVHTLAIRFEPRRQKAPSAARPANGAAAADPPRDQNSFSLKIDYIKALPGGQETDFILVSCAGAGIEPEKRAKLLKAKMAGESALRNSGLGYTIIRPGPLLEEPGGQKALIFDQGNRISQMISCADVADVCLKALHNPSARNKSFDVCYEYTPDEGEGLYELVAHLPDKSNNYLTPALAVLEKNT